MQKFVAIAICLLTLVFANLTSAAEPAKKLLIIGDKPDGHPKFTHEFMKGGRILADLLKDQPDLEVTLVDGQEPFEEGPELIRSADGVVIFVSEGAKWAQLDPRRYDALTQLAARGGGISALHWGIGAKDPKYIEGYKKLIGGIHGGTDRKYVKLMTKVTPTAGHPITRGVDPFEIKDEFYYELKFAKDGKLTPIMQVELEDSPQTVAWAWQRPDGGRSFGYCGLHYHDNWQRDEYRRFISQGVIWTMNREKGI